MGKVFSGVVLLLLAFGAVWARPALGQSPEPETAPPAAEASEASGSDGSSSAVGTLAEDAETSETPAPILSTSETPAPSDVLAGPRSVTQTLKPGDGLTSPQFRAPGFRDTFPAWFALKDRLKKEDHLDLGADYTLVGALSTSDLGAGNAVGHDLRFYGTWTAVNPGGPNAGSLTVKVESRAAYTPVAPQDLGFDSGAVAITAAQFSNAGWVLTNFYWKQRLLADRVTIGFGQIDVTDYTDLFPLANPVWGFMNLAFSISPAIPVPSQGLGAAMGVCFPRHLYFITGIADANGDPASPLRNVFRNGETFQAAEVGYTSSRERQFLDNIHLTVWSQDARAEQGVPADSGISASASWGFRNNTWWPFLRGGWSDKGTALDKASISAGVGYLTPQQDLFGLGLNWGRPGGGEGLPNQWILETFYKYQASATSAISLDVQQILHPALSPKQNIIGIYSLRLRLVF